MAKALDREASCRRDGGGAPDKNIWFGQAKAGRIFETEPVSRKLKRISTESFEKFLQEAKPHGLTRAVCETDACEAEATAVTTRMPAVELIQYCASCDEARGLLAAATQDEDARVAVLREHPRRLATKTDVAGIPMCARCLEYATQHRTAGFYFEQQDCPRDSVF